MTLAVCQKGKKELEILLQTKIIYNQYIWMDKGAILNRKLEKKDK